MYNLSSNKNINCIIISIEDTNNLVTDSLTDVDIERSIKKHTAMLTRTKSDNSNRIEYITGNVSNICVVCDTFIIGMETIQWV